MSFSLFKCCKSKEATGTGVAAAIVALATGAGALFHSTNNFSRGRTEPSQLAGVTFVDSRSRSKIVDLRGDWRFSLGDESRWSAKEFDDSGWGLIDVPSDWEGEGYDAYNGYAWYRRSFKIGSTPKNQSLYLLLGEIDDVDEAYVNGKRVGGTGQFPPDYVTAWNLERVYPLPDGLLERGQENVVAVRVYDGAQGGGLRRGTIGIYASDLPQPLINLSGVWKLRKGDDPGWAAESLDETGFESVKVPSYWDYLGYENYDGYAWYRKTFELTSIPENETMVLLLGKIDDADETFLNGTKVGGTGTDADSDVPIADAWSARRAYEFPSSLLKANNTVAVRVYDGQAYGGIYEGPIGIMTKTDYDLYWEMVESNRGKTFKTMIDWLLGRE
jgi:sialate O-acetylesterase